MSIMNVCWKTYGTSISWNIMQLFIYDYMSPEKYKSIQQFVTGERRGSWRKREKRRVKKNEGHS